MVGALNEKEDKYPILVRRFTSDQSLTIVCVVCEAEAVISQDDILNDGWYACPAGCDGIAVFKYEEADTCPSCGKLGFFEAVLDGCCSRVCKLQHEYAQRLAAERDGRPEGA